MISFGVLGGRPDVMVGEESPDTYPELGRGRVAGNACLS